MKKNNFLLIIIVLISFACTTTNGIKVRFEVENKASYDISQYEDLIITDLLIIKETKDFDINKEIYDYFSEEIKKRTQLKISKNDLFLTKKSQFDQAGFWKKVLPEKKNSLFLTGSIEYSKETRKALAEKGKRRFEDPFPDGPLFNERRHFTLLFDLYLIDSESGKTVYKKTFNESQSYKNQNQTPYFAFFDLIQRVKSKLFNDLLAQKKFQQRYLIK